MRRTLLAIGGAIALIVVIGAAFVLWTSGSAVVPSVTEQVAPEPGGAGGLAIAPVRSVVTSDQGDAVIPYAISNDSDDTREYSLSVVELTAEGAELSEGPQSAARWVTLESTRITVAPRSTGQFDVVVEPPADRGASERRIALAVTDSTVESGGDLEFNLSISTSIYVEGIGETSRSAQLHDLQLPPFAGPELQVGAQLTNSGTVLLVPGARRGTILGTNSNGEQFSLSGPVVRPGETIVVEGVARMPFACWCEIRVTAPDGEDGYTSVTGRVLVLPWWWILGGLAVAVLVVILLEMRRRATAKRS